VAGRLWECAAFIRAFDLRGALEDGSAGDESAVKTTHSQIDASRLRSSQLTDLQDLKCGVWR